MPKDQPPADFDALMRARRSVRRFLDAPVPRAAVARILETARLAPSGANLQPGKVYVLDGKRKDDLVADLSAAFLSGDKGTEEYSYFPAKMPDHLKKRRNATGWALYGSLGIERRDVDGRKAQHLRNYQFFDAPVGLIVTIERSMGSGCYMDLGMFLQSLMLAARADGFDTCGIGAMAPYHAIIRRHLPISDDEVVVCGMALGVRDPEAPENNYDLDRLQLFEFTDFSGFSED